MLSIKKIKYDYRKPTIDLINDLKLIMDKNNPTITWWTKNNKWYIRQDKKNGILWCNYDRIWSVIELDYNMTYDETQLFIQNIMESQFKLGYLTPRYDSTEHFQVMVRQFKLNIT